MKIDRESCNFNKEAITKIEEIRNATYICDTQVKAKNGGWADPCVSIFYQETPHPEGSNYFGLYYDGDNNLMVCNALSATLEPFTGVEVNGVIYFSRYRHDFREVGGVAIDGGRDYVRLVGDVGVPQYELRIVKDKIIYNKYSKGE